MGNIPPPGCLYKNQGERIWDLKQQIYQNVKDTQHNINAINQILTIYDQNVNDLDATRKLYEDTSSNYKLTDDNMKSNIDNLVQNIETLLAQTGKNYSDIDKLIKQNDITMNNINSNKKDILQKSNSIVYFENLLLAAYLEIYNSVVGQNRAISNNKSSRVDMYSIDNSTYVYQQKRIQFYKNLNTGLFFTYYVLILVLVYVILKLDSENSILVKLTLFRLFVVILIAYPLFILRFQHFIYSLFHYFYDRLSPNKGL
jgi:ferritin-like metal-binding protein YciE